MTSSADLVLAIALTTLPPLGLGADPGANATAANAVPDAWGAAVAGAVAQRWQVAPATVTLTWGQTPASWPAAATPFQLSGSGADGWFALVLRPADGVPSAVRVRAGVPESVWVATRSLASGERLAAADVRGAVRVHWGAPVRTARPAPEPGSEVRRAIPEGQVVAWPAVVAPPLVSAGEPVRLEWTSGAVTVAMTGVALNSARRGEAVRARVDGRGRLVATVTGRGAATLAPGGER